MSNDLKKEFSFCLPKGKPILPHLLRCRGLAVEYYSFALGRLEAGVPSTFAQLGSDLSVGQFNERASFFSEIARSGARGGSKLYHPV
jgi:hypothetical protein